MRRYGPQIAEVIGRYPPERGRRRLRAAEAAMVLALEGGRVVEHGDICARMGLYLGHEPENICRLYETAKRLRNRGFGIIAHRGVGYQMTWTPRTVSPNAAALDRLAQIERLAAELRAILNGTEFETEGHGPAGTLAVQIERSRAE
jgi:hypothetical protein